MLVVRVQVFPNAIVVRTGKFGIRVNELPSFALSFDEEVLIGKKVGKPKGRVATVLLTTE